MEEKEEEGGGSDGRGEIEREQRGGAFVASILGYLCFSTWVPVFQYMGTCASIHASIHGYLCFSTWVPVL